MTVERWRVADDGWGGGRRVAGGGWREEGGGRRVASGGWRVTGFIVLNTIVFFFLKTFPYALLLHNANMV